MKKIIFKHNCQNVVGQKSIVIGFVITWLAFLSGSLSAGVVCSNGAIGSAIDRGFNPSASMPVIAGPFNVKVPTPPGCDANTFIALAGGPLWTWKGGGNGVNGDKVDWSKSWINGLGYGQVLLDPNDSLDSAITAVSQNASISLDVSAIQTSPTTATFTIEWSGSDLGTAQHLRWYEYTGPAPDQTLFEGDNTELPNWDSLSMLVHEEFRVGPWDETIFVDINASTNMSNIILSVNGVAASIVPIPASAWLFGSAVAGLIGFKRRK